MRKKIALLLAAAMLIGLIPASTIFAASSYQFINTPTTVQTGTLMVEWMGPNGVPNLHLGSTNQGVYINPSIGVSDGTNTYAMTIKLATDNQVEVTSIKLAGVEITGSITSTSGAAVTVADNVRTWGDFAIAYPANPVLSVGTKLTIGNLNSASVRRIGDSGATKLSFRVGDTKNDVSYVVTAPYLLVKLLNGASTGDAFSINLTNAVFQFGNKTALSKYLNWDIESTIGGRSYDPTRGSWAGTTDATSTSGRYTRNTTSINGSLPVAWLPAASTGYDAYEVAYTLDVSSASSSRANVTIQQNVPTNDRNDYYVVIPLVARANTEGDVTATMTNTVGSTITPTVVAFANAGSGTFNAYVDTVQTARESWYINKLVINETRINSFAATNTYTLTLPRGFEWNRSKTSTELKAIFEGGFASSAGSNTVTPTSIEYGKTSYWTGSGTSSEDVYNKLVITVTAPNNRSSSLPGTVIFTNLYYVAEDGLGLGIGSNAAYDIMMDIQIGDGTAQSIKAGVRDDWNFSFKLNNDVRTLVSGRYEPYFSGDALVDSLTNDYHYIGSVTFSEVVSGTWHAERTTRFELSPGVKLRNMVISAADKLDEKDDLKAGVKEATYPIYSFVNGAWKANGFNDYYDESYPTDGRRHGYVSVSNEANTDGEEFSVITITGVHPTTGLNDKATVTMKLWLSVAATYEGDIKLTATGSALREYTYDRNDVQSIVIAKAVPPVKVETKETEIKIGYQYQKTADIKITENGAGYLLRGKTLKVSISDYITDDIVFTPGFKVNVTDGDLKITNLRTTSTGNAFSETLSTTGHGTITMDIGGASTKASTIEVTNLQVQVNRVVPQSNESEVTGEIGYKVVAWGSAVAENFGTKGYIANNANMNVDMFSYVPGIVASYVKVITSASGLSYTKDVRVTIGKAEVVVGGETLAMDTAAYISPASNSTMVPVRFISVAMGIPDEQVVWDGNARTVTIYNGARIIQFTIGSDQILVNGVSTTMYSPDNLPVKAEIKDDRSFIPFRALGNALGVQVDWDPATQTAIYKAQPISQ